MGQNLSLDNNNTNIHNKIHLKNRLLQIKNERYLTHRIFGRISENLHYEIMKYLNCREILEIRITKLGGFQLSSNKLLRSRIKNYFPQLKPNINYHNNIEKYYSKLQTIFEQTGRESLNLNKMNINKNILKKWEPLIKLNPELKEINLGNYLDIVYIYISLGFNKIGNSGLHILIEYFTYLPNLQILNLRILNIFLFMSI